MKLLFDENLSYKLCDRVKDIYPNSTHTRIEGLGNANDLDVWRFAATNGFTIVSKDSDFNDLVVLYDFPPQVIWIRSGNSTVAAMEELLRSHYSEIEAFIRESKHGLLEVVSRHDIE